MDSKPADPGGLDRRKRCGWRHLKRIEGSAVIFKDERQGSGPLFDRYMNRLAGMFGKTVPDRVGDQFLENDFEPVAKRGLQRLHGRKIEHPAAAILDGGNGVVQDKRKLAVDDRGGPQPAMFAPLQWPIQRQGPSLRFRLRQEE